MIICFDTNRPPIAACVHPSERTTPPRLPPPLPHRVGPFVDEGKLILRANCPFPQFM